ncbi:hypothetical protein RDI58_007534 [Solanum bulbocastanum]|uniref:Uncharacterized protein n=1 Tax=Solanum bulbocastanum TaxID=147425 RepID=A0AAN8YJB4_SOLBU
MLQARDKIDQEIWWEPRGGHANLWYDNWTQLGALRYVLHITHGPTEGYKDFHQIMEHDGWNIIVMAELLNKEICDHMVEEEEEPWWMSNITGKLLVSSARSMIRQRKRNKMGIMNIR